MIKKGTGKESDILLTELHSTSICEMAGIPPLGGR